MLYKFKNGVAEEWKDGKPVAARGEDIAAAMKASEYVTYMSSDETVGPLNPFSVMVYRSKEVPVKWVVHVWDQNEYIEEYHVENSFDLATLVNTFCAPLGILRLA